MSYEKGIYWRQRADMLYYQYFNYMIRCIGPEARSILDVGSGNSPYLEWFDWIPEKVSVDIRTPYQSETVRGIEGDIHTLRFPERFDICTCMQVLEHIPQPEPFARRLLELGHLVLVSVPFRWPAGTVKGHVNDPVDLERVTAWFGRAPNYHQVVREPFVDAHGSRMFALFDPADSTRKFGPEIRKGRRPL